MRVWEHESMRERHYGTMILWCCEILPLLCYDSMRHDTLIVWDYEWKRYWLYVALFCVFVCIWSTLVFSYCPASFSSFVFKSLSLCFLFYLLFATAFVTVIVPLLLFPCLYFLLHSFQAFLVPTYFFSRLCQGTTGPEGQSTTRPQDQNHRTRGPQDTAPQDHRTRGPQDQRTTGPEEPKFLFQGL